MSADAMTPSSATRPSCDPATYRRYDWLLRRTFHELSVGRSTVRPYLAALLSGARHVGHSAFPTVMRAADAARAAGDTEVELRLRRRLGDVALLVLGLTEAEDDVSELLFLEGPRAYRDAAFLGARLGRPSAAVMHHLAAHFGTYVSALRHLRAKFLNPGGARAAVEASPSPMR
jgi:hypothetical protein